MNKIDIVKFKIFKRKLNARMNNFTQRMITISIGIIISLFLLTYNTITQNFIITISTLLIHFELGYGLYFGNKIILYDLIILALLVFMFYYELFVGYACYLEFIFGLLFGILFNMSVERKNVLIYFLGSILWILPTIYLTSLYLYKNPYVFINSATIIWFSDGGAYIFGKLLGKNKLAPTISPNKTMEGLFFGVFTSIVVGYIIYHRSEKYIDYIILSFLYGLFAQIGDLVESAFKRWVGLKDSGFILPGIGGINDRCDSLFLAIPTGYLYMIMRNIDI